MVTLDLIKYELNDGKKKGLYHPQCSDHKRYVRSEYFSAVYISTIEEER
jgi:hypothetical protein